MRFSCKGFDGRDLQASVAVATVAMGNTEWYRGSGIAVRTETVRPRGYSFTLRVADKDVIGAYRTGSGRRSIYACWHVHRDVMSALFTLHPYATIDTGAGRGGTTYRGRDHFEDTFPATAWQNVGSEAEPVLRRNACQCGLRTDEYGRTVQRTIDRLLLVRPLDQRA
jgi:hypothetical protein